MKQLHVYSYEDLSQANALHEAAHCLRRSESHSLPFAPWPAYPFKPEVRFRLAYDSGHLYLQFIVKEPCLRAAHGSTNEPVYEDSCVEFFVAFDSSGYYNLEFNCIGTILAGYGNDRHQRSLLPDDALATIERQVIISKAPAEPSFTWELTAKIPLGVFVFHSLTSLKGQRCRANFYKCGDLLPQPHYLAWSNIESEQPNFHLPAFFGTLLFE